MNQILLIEDDQEIAKIIQHTLTNDGYHVTWATTGLEGLADFKAAPFDLVLVDWMLPEMDGLQVIEHIRLESDIPIIMISARNTEVDKVTGLADAAMETLDITMPTQITVPDAKNMLGDFLAFPASTGYELLTIEDMEVPETKEIALTYLKDGEPAFTLSIFSLTDTEPLSADSAVKVHGQPAEITDEQFFKLLLWDEDGLRYGIILQDEELTFEEVLALTEKMEVIQ